LKKFFYLGLFFLILIGITYIFYKMVFFPPQVFEKRLTQKIEFKNKLPIIAKEKLYPIADLEKLPKNSVVKIEGKIVQIKKDGDRYIGIIEDSTGRVKFFLKTDILKNNEAIAQIIDDAVFLDINFSFIVKKKEGYVEVLDAI